MGIDKNNTKPRSLSTIPSNTLKTKLRADLHARKLMRMASSSSLDFSDIESLSKTMSHNPHMARMMSGAQAMTPRDIYSQAPSAAFEPQGGSTSKPVDSTDNISAVLNSVSEYIVGNVAGGAPFMQYVNHDSFPPDTLKAALAAGKLPLITCWCGDYATVRCSDECPILYCSEDCKELNSAAHNCATLPHWYDSKSYADDPVLHALSMQYPDCGTCHKASFTPYCSTACNPNIGFKPQADDDEKTEEGWAQSIFGLFTKLKEFFTRVMAAGVDFASTTTVKLWANGIIQSVRSIFKENENTIVITIFTLLFITLLQKFTGASILKEMMHFILKVFKVVILAVSATAGLFVKTLGKITGLMEKESEDNFEPQMGQANDGSIALLATLLSATTFASSGAMNLKTLGSSIAYARNIRGGLSEATDGFSWLLEKLPSFVQKFLFDTFGMLRDSGDIDAMLDVDCLRKDLIKIRKEEGPSLNDISFCDLFIQRYVSVSAHVHDFKNGWSPQKRTLISSLIKECSSHVGHAQSTCDAHEKREPVGIILNGKPGVGKTQMIHAIAAHFYYKFPKRQLFFWKNVNDAFWSGYGGQKIVILDDLFAIRNEQMDNDIIAELLRIISPGDMSLNMPFGGKGCTFFVSGLVIITTNRDMNTPFKSAQDYRAFMRRFLYFEVELLSEYMDSKGVLDVSKLADLSDLEKASFPHIRMHLRFIKDPEQYKQTSSQGVFLPGKETLTFDESLVVVRAEMLKKEKSSQVSDGILGAIKKREEGKDNATSLISNLIPAPFGTFVPEMDDGKFPLSQREQEICRNAAALTTTTTSTTTTSTPGVEPISYGVPVSSTHLTGPMWSTVVGSTSRFPNAPVVDFRALPKWDYFVMPQVVKSSFTKAGNRLGNHRRPDKPKKSKFDIPDLPPGQSALQASYDILNEAQLTNSDFQAQILESVSSPEKTWSKVLKHHLNGVASSSYLIPLASIIAACSAVAVVVRVFKTSASFLTESYGGAKAQQFDARRRNPIVRMPGAAKVFAPQSSGHWSDVHTLIKENTGSIECNGCKQGLTIIAGTIGRTATHFFKSSFGGEWMPDGQKVNVYIPEKNGMQKYEWSFNLQDLRLSELTGNLASDVCFINFRRLFPSKKNIVKHHVSESRLTNRRMFTNCGLVTNYTETGCNNGYVVYESSKFIKYSACKASEPDIIIPAHIKCSILTIKGQCGETLVGQENGVNVALASHSGSRSGTAYCTIVTREMCQTMIDHFNDSSDFVNQQYEAPKNIIDVAIPEVNGAYVPIGRVPDAPKGCSNKTKLRPSLIKDSIPGNLTMEPALLGHPSDSRSEKTTKQLLYDVLNRTTPKTTPIAHRYVDMAVESLFDECRRFPPSFPLRCLSLHEALNGNEHVKGYPMSGSPGYPSTLYSKGIKGKYGIIKVEDGIRTIFHEPTLLRFHAMGEMLDQGVVPFIPFTKVLKDEALPLAKIEIGKTRGIEPVCAIFNLHVKMRFGMMLAWLQEQNVNIPFKVGMNVYSPQWDSHVRRHLAIGPTGFDGDIKTQECMIRSEIYDAIYDFADKAFTAFGASPPTATERRARRAILCTLLHSYVMVGDALYRTKFGNPSGNFLTAFIASFTSGILLRCSFFGLAEEKDPEYASSFSYNTNVRDSLCGDDNVVTRSSRVEHFFTGRNVSSYCANKWGVTYTDSSKATVYPDDKPFEELSFLSNTTRVSDEFSDIGVKYLPVLGESSKIKCVSFIRTTAGDGDPYVAIVDNSNSLLRLVATSGRAEFHKTRDMLYSAFNKIGTTPELLDYVTCTSKFRDGTLDLDYETDQESKFIPQYSSTKVLEVISHPKKVVGSISRGLDMLGDRQKVVVALRDLIPGHDIDLASAEVKLDSRIELLRGVDANTADQAFEHAGITSDTPIIVKPDGEKYIVLEGNGRVKALSAVFDDDLPVTVEAVIGLDDVCQDVFEPQMDDGLSFSSSANTQSGGGQPEEKKDTSTTGEDLYSFSGFLARMQLQASVTWSSSDPQHTILSSFNVPFGLIGRTTQDAVAKFIYLKSGVKVKVQVQSNGFQQGMLAVVFCPLYGVARTLKYQLNSLTSISVAPNMQLMAGSTSEIEFDIPFIHPYNALNTANATDSEFETLGTLSLVVFNPLKTGVGGQEFCTVNVYAALTDAELTVPRPPPYGPGYAPPVARAVAPTRNYPPRRTPVIRTRVGDFIPQMDIVGGLAKTVLGDSDDNVSKVISGAIDAVTTASELVPFLDVPSNGIQPTNILNRAAPFMNNTMNQMHSCNVMDDNPGQKSMPTASDMGSSAQETSLKHCMTKFSFVNTFTLKVDDLEGAVKAKIPMCPVIKTSNADVDDIVQVPLCEYMALMYAMWRGGLKLMVQVICTDIQTGRLAICSHYGCSSDDVAFEDIMAQNCTMMEFGNGKKSITVEIPYRSNHPWLKIPTTAMSNSGVGEAVDVLSYSMGEISIRVATRMTAMESVAQEVDVNVYWACGDDIELAYQSSRFVDYRPVLDANHRTLPPQLEDEKFEPQMMGVEDAEPATLDQPQQTAVLSNSAEGGRGGQSYESNQPDALMLTHRFTPFHYSNAATGPADIVLTTGDPFVQRTPAGTDIAPMAASMWAAQPFVAYAGSMRILVRSPESSLTLYADRGTDLVSNTFPYMRPEVAGGGPVDYITPTHDFTMMQFPMSIPNKFMILPKDETDSKNDLCSAATFVIKNTNAAGAGTRGPVTSYAATGDHMHFSMLSFVPHVHVSTTPFYQHVRAYETNLPEFILMTHVAGGAAWPFSQATTLTYRSNFIPAGLIGQRPASVRVPVDILDDAQILTLLGITAPAQRVYNSGQTQVVNTDFTTSQVILHTSEISVKMGVGGTPINFALDDFMAIPLGTALQTSGVSAAPGWKLSGDAYSNANVRALLLGGAGIPAGEVVIPAPGLSYALGTTADEISPIVGPSIPYAGGSLFNWDADPGHLKSFYDTGMIPFDA